MHKKFPVNFFLSVVVMGGEEEDIGIVVHRLLEEDPLHPDDDEYLAVHCDMVLGSVKRGEFERAATYLTEHDFLRTTAQEVIPFLAERYAREETAAAYEPDSVVRWMERHNPEDAEPETTKDEVLTALQEDQYDGVEDAAAALKEKGYSFELTARILLRLNGDHSDLDPFRLRDHVEHGYEEM